MKILGIETSTLTASVAVCDGESVVAKGDSSVNTHSEQLLVLVDAALAEAGLTLADLDGVAVGAGPGSFTGLRIGMATAKGLAYAAGKPLWAVSSLAAVASDLFADRDVGDRVVVPVLDARRKEVFVGFFRASGDGVTAIAPERVLPPADLHALIAGVAGDRRPLLLGNGLDIYAAAFGDSLDAVADRAIGAPSLPSATAVTRLARAGKLPDVLTSGTPAYVRPSEAEIKFPHGNTGGTFTP